MAGKQPEMITVPAKATAEDLKLQYAKGDEEKAKQLKIIYMGRFLKNEDVLCESGVVNNACIHVIVSKKTEPNQTEQTTTNLNGSQLQIADIENALNTIGIWLNITDLLNFILDF